MTEHQYPLEPFFGKIISPFERFLKQTTSGGIILMGMTIVTLIVATSPLGDYYRNYWELEVGINLGLNSLKMSAHAWVNDGLMSLFFLLVGLELKREILVGELASIRNAILPIAGAVGGMIFPALIYYSFNNSGPGMAGWGIPMATDIAFSVGILVLLAWRVPRNLIIFLTALAIVDDLGAVLIIALFYTQAINMELLGIAIVILGVLVLINRGGVRSPYPYIVLGSFLWLALLRSGIHATLSGVLTAFTIPAIPTYTPEHFRKRIKELGRVLDKRSVEPEERDTLEEITEMTIIAECVEKDSANVQSPQQRMEHRLAPWVTFGIIPLFAMANAGLDLGRISLRETLIQPVTLGVILGLVPGKFLGITLFSWIAVKTGLAKLPGNTGWGHIMGAAWLGGIGFTMSLFIDQLAFTRQFELFEQTRIGILAASLISAITGLAWLYVNSLKKRR